MLAIHVLLWIGDTHTSLRGAKQTGEGIMSCDPQAQAPKNALPPPDMMVDLASRFVLNAPAEELKSFERMLFLIEQVSDPLSRPRSRWCSFAAVTHRHPHSAQPLGPYDMPTSPWQHELDSKVARYMSLSTTPQLPQRA
jgi:hypothetical protein